MSCPADRRSMHCLRYVPPRSAGRYIGTVPHCPESIPKRREQSDTPACCFHSRIAHIPDHHLTSSSTSRAYSSVLLKQFSSSSSAWSSFSSCRVLSCPVIVCRPAFWIPSLRFDLGLPSLLADLFIRLIDRTRTATGLYNYQIPTTP